MSRTKTKARPARRERRERPKPCQQATPKARKACRDRVSAKIAALVDEGKPQRQAVAMALSMEQAGRLRAGGVYVPAKKGTRAAVLATRAPFTVASKAVRLLEGARWGEPHGGLDYVLLRFSHRNLNGPASAVLTKGQAAELRTAFDWLAAGASTVTDQNLATRASLTLAAQMRRAGWAPQRVPRGQRASKPRATRDSFTGLNAEVTRRFLAEGRGVIGQVPVGPSIPHLRRAIDAGVLVPGKARGTWVLAPDLSDAWLEARIRGGSPRGARSAAVYRTVWPGWLRGLVEDLGSSHAARMAGLWPSYDVSLDRASKDFERVVEQYLRSNPGGFDDYPALERAWESGALTKAAEKAIAATRVQGPKWPKGLVPHRRK